jgi:hypothetical protein
MMMAPADTEIGRGDLHATVSGNKLYVPKAAAQTFGQQGVRTASDLLSYMQTYPSSVAASLHWTAADVSAATDKLRTQLTGKVDISTLDTEQNPTPPLGARDPSGLPDKSGPH